MLKQSMSFFWLLSQGELVFKMGLIELIGFRCSLVTSRQLNWTGIQIPKQSVHSTLRRAQPQVHEAVNLL